MLNDKLLAPTDIEEAVSEAYAHAVAAAAGYVVAQRNFDRDGVDITFEAGDAFRPKIDAQLKATINLSVGEDGLFRYACRIRNYNLLRIPTQTPRILIVLHLPPERTDWVTISDDCLMLRNCAFWVSLIGAPETENKSSITIDVPSANRFNPDALRELMDRSRNGVL
jgi:hypothetical protein